MWKKGMKTKDRMVNKPPLYPGLRVWLSWLTWRETWNDPFHAEIVTYKISDSTNYPFLFSKHTVKATKRKEEKSEFSHAENRPCHPQQNEVWKLACTLPVKASRVVSYPMRLSKHRWKTCHSDWLPMPPGVLRSVYHLPRNCRAVSLGNRCLSPFRQRSTGDMVTTAYGQQQSTCSWKYTQTSHEKLPWWQSTLMRDHPDKILPLRDHPDNRPPWWEITLTRDHPYERPS